jgi:outer membrane protein assembly factor BamB
MAGVLALILVSVLALSSEPAFARSDAGDVLWHNQFDLAGGDDLGAAMAVDGGRVVIVGSARNVDGDLDFLVRTVDAKSGDLLWQDQVDIAGGDDMAVAVVMDGQRVVVAGRGKQTAPVQLLILRSYHPKTGALEWEVRSPDSVVTGLGMDDGRVVIVGSAAAGSFIRVYKAKTGALLWADNLIPGGHFNLEHLLGKRVVVQGDMAFTATTVTDPTTGDFRRCLVRAYHTAKARLEWESLSGSGTCRALTIATDRRQVFVAGQTGAMEDDFHIRAFDAKTGVELWRRQSSVFSDRENAALAVDIERHLVFVAGWRLAANGIDRDAFLVQAYTTETGELRWQDVFATGSRCFCRARDVVADSGRVFAVGEESAGRRWLVRAYDASDGTLIWDDDFVFPNEPAPTGDNAILGPRAAAVMGGRLFVGGSGVGANRDGDIVVRGYDAK